MYWNWHGTSYVLLFCSEIPLELMLHVIVGHDILLNSYLLHLFKLAWPPLKSISLCCWLCVIYCAFLSTKMLMSVGDDDTVHIITWGSYCRQPSGQLYFYQSYLKYSLFEVVFLIKKMLLTNYHMGLIKRFKHFC